MNSTGIEIEKVKLLTRIAEGLKQRPAYLLLFGILVVYMLILAYFASIAASRVAQSSIAVIIVSLFVAAYVIRTVEVSGRVPQRHREVVEQLLALGTHEDIPLSEAKARRWAKRWNCRWTYLSESGHLLPYVDDNVTFDPSMISTETGHVVGRGESPYRGGTTYELFGRISKRDMGLMFYRFRGETEALMGVVVLRMRAGGSIYGWWLGLGKENVDVGGRCEWTEANREPSFRAQEYDTGQDPPRR